MISKLQVKDLSHSYTDGQIIFENVNAELPLNEIVFLEGEVGSGRSSLLKMMAALIMPKSGSIVINDEKICEMSFEEFLPLRRRIGYSFEYGGLLNNRTIRDNLMLPVLYHSILSVSEANQKIDQICKKFGLSKVANLRPSSVSGSQRKACVVARAFVMQPELVILDEPFAGLSSESVSDLKKFILEEKQLGNLKHVFVSCQNSRDVAGFATQILLVERNSFASGPFFDEQSHEGAA